MYPHILGHGYNISTCKITMSMSLYTVNIFPNEKSQHDFIKSCKPWQEFITRVKTI